MEEERDAGMGWEFRADSKRLFRYDGCVISLGIVTCKPAFAWTCPPIGENMKVLPRTTAYDSPATPMGRYHL